MEGALNGFPDHDELYWNAVGTEWGVPIDSASADVSTPAAVVRVACFAGPLESGAPCGNSSFKGGQATFLQPGLNPYEGLTVVVAFPTGAVPTPRPILVERWAVQRAFSVNALTGGVAGGLAVVLAFGLGYLFWTKGRDRRAVGSPVDVAYGTSQGGEQLVPLFEHGATPVEYAPPDDIRPGQVGTLVDETARPLDVTATIVDLAVRGYLRIEEMPKKGWLAKPDWTLVKLKAGDGLLPYERILFDGLFAGADAAADAAAEEAEAADDAAAAMDEAAPEDAPARPDQPAMPRIDREHDLAQVKLSALKQHFLNRLHRVENALYTDVVKRGWFAGRPDKVRTSWKARGWALAVVAGVVTGVVARFTHYALLPIPLVLAGLALVAGARWMPHRTPKGTGMIRRVLGFRTYIETAEVDEARFAEKENLFSQYLPFAIVFGCTEKWARAFAKLGQQPPSMGWYVGSRPFTTAAFASSIDHFSVATSGVIASAPAGSGHSGFGGGGFSGGGGGGGGGGSW